MFYTGTSGYSYKEWKGIFYPEKLPDKEMLSFYGSKLPAVEINNTFYRMPKRAVLQAWADSVPDDFRFIIKASRRITHFKRLKEAEELMMYLFENTQELGDKLGAVLFQLPPNMKVSMERIEPFVELIPAGVRVAFEFRHPTWFDQAVYDCLSERNIAICHADSEDSDLPFVSTADWGYLRLRRPGYDKRSLSKWIKKIVDSNWKDSFVFFKHEDEAAGPKLAVRYQDMTNPVQGMLPEGQNSDSDNPRRKPRKRPQA